MVEAIRTRSVRYQVDYERNSTSVQTMPNDEAQITARLEEVLESIFCPVVGCWPLHGCRYEFFHDCDAESYGLEVWPVGVEEPDEHEGNGHHRRDEGLLYELAEFDFVRLAQMSLEHFQFSQRRSIFEIGWKEDGQMLELRVHIMPIDVGEE